MRREQTVRDTADAILKAAQEVAQGGDPLPLADEAFGRRVAQIRKRLAAEHGDDARRIVTEAIALVREAVQPNIPCSCGRRLRYLNPASSRPNCEGCGFPSDSCRCHPLTEDEERHDHD